MTSTLDASQADAGRADNAFAGEIIERIQNDSAREELDKLIWDRLEANPHLA